LRRLPFAALSLLRRVGQGRRGEAGLRGSPPTPEDARSATNPKAPKQVFLFELDVVADTTAVSKISGAVDHPIFYLKNTGMCPEKTCINLQQAMSVVEAR